MTEVFDVDQQDIELDIPKARALVINFYRKNAPDLLADGLDVSGLVEWILENGLNRFNVILQKHYKTIIRVADESGTTRENHNRTSRGITPGLFSPRIDANQRLKIRIDRRLNKFYMIHDEKKLTPEHRIQFERCVNFGALHGIGRLNILLERKYGNGISEEDVDSVVEEEIEEETEVVNYLIELEDIDEVRLKADLTGYFAKVQAEDQIDILDENIDWICRMGFTKWNKTSEQLYGRQFDSVLVELGREPWTKENVKDIVLTPNIEDNEAQIVKYNKGVEVEEEFEDISEDLIKEELSCFYEFYDPDNLENLQELVSFAKELGRNKLNLHLIQIYGVGLRKDKKYLENNISPTLERNKKQNEERQLKVKKQNIIVEDLGLVVEEQNINDLEPKKEEKGRELFQKVKETKENNKKKGFLFSFRSKRKQKQQKLSTQTTFDFQDDAMRKQERNRKGGSLFTVLNGKKVKKNIIEECLNYELNTESGLGFCTHCGLSKIQHGLKDKSTGLMVAGNSGRVARMVAEKERKMKKKPRNRILEKIKLAEKEKDAKNPFMMLSSRQMRQGWADDEADEIKREPKIKKKKKKSLKVKAQELVEEEIVEIKEEQVETVEIVEEEVVEIKDEEVKEVGVSI